MIPLYFVFKVTKSRKTYALIFLAFVILFVFFAPILNGVLSNVMFIEKYIGVIEYRYYFGGGSAASFIKGIPFYIITVLSIIYRDAIKKETEYADLLIIACSVYSMSWLLTFNMYWFFRSGWYLLLPTLLMIQPLFRNMKKNKAHLLLGYLAIISMILLTYRQIWIILY